MENADQFPKSKYRVPTTFSSENQSGFRSCGIIAFVICILLPYRHLLSNVNDDTSHFFRPLSFVLSVCWSVHFHLLFSIQHFHAKNCPRWNIINSQNLPIYIKQKSQNEFKFLEKLFLLKCLCYARHYFTDNRFTFPYHHLRHFTNYIANCFAVIEQFSNSFLYSPYSATHTSNN